MNKKNIIILMYNFPPIGAGRGIAWTYIADRLSSQYNVDVVTINPSINDPLYNNNKKKLIKNTYKVHRTKTSKFYQFLYKKNKKKKKNIGRDNDSENIRNHNSFIKKIYKIFIRPLLFPDRMIFWNKFAEKEISKIMKSKEIDLIISVGFPFSTHILANKLKKKYKLKLILDYGDPWSFNPSGETIPQWRKNIDYFFENRIIKNADFITVTTKKTEKKFKEKFDISNKIDVIPQGVNIKKYTSEINNVKLNQDNFIKKNNYLKLFYSGIFYKDIRNPANFFEALSSMNNDDVANVKLKIIIAGKMEDYIFEKVDNLEFCDKIEIEFLGNINFDEVIELQINSDGLLFFGNKGSLQIPGKLYEYIAAQRPIFAISPTNDESCDIIKRTNRGIVTNNNISDIKANLKKFIYELTSKSNEFDLKERTEFDWEKISFNYLNIVNKVVGGNEK